MDGKVAWGVLSTAKIGTGKVIPSMQKGSRTAIQAIASRSEGQAREVADLLGIPRAYGSYEELLADPAIEAIYNPLPNHLHVPWTIKALEAGKHVLCEKPIALTAGEAEQLVEARDRSGKLVAEAFMVRFHPQWRRAREIVRSGEIGELRAIQTFFSYFNDDPGNVRNMADIGGGGLYDIGCYAIASARFIMEAEPERVVAALDRDPAFGTDRLSSGLAVFPGNRHLTFTCSTQLVPYQRVQICGTKGRIEVEIPFNAPLEIPCRLRIDDGKDLSGASARVEEMPVADQYTLQGDAFSRAVLGEEPWEFPIEDAVANMRIIDALFRAGNGGGWQTV
ncbi:Predicted dehydrogenase [Faunimonas pinastri]|uniref:Predicted dehydrogenase n=1 Tax=Faunimonas pinastri TaxID=1855383 RepID=A0A1H9AQL9_9HYPH|nr:Gfo/Idh/MocA family oxidoreductase [Faunimonas pinastri]SEP79020.1 Predicted dehydrogenase [Faunimonas pinastri]